MTMWPFGRKKKPSRGEERAHDEDEDLGISTHISGPKGTTPAASVKSVKTQGGKRAFIRNLTKKWLHPDHKSRNARSAPLGSKLSSKPASPPSSRTASKSRTAEASTSDDKITRRLKRSGLPTTEAEILELLTETPLEKMPASDKEGVQLPAEHQNSSDKQAQAYKAAPVPTLKAKQGRAGTDGLRAKPSKRKLEQKQREQQIRSMTTPNPEPKRLRSFTNSGPLAQDTLQVRNGLNSRLERPLSDISLPMNESLRSSFIEAAIAAHQFRINGLDALSPRPTIRYAEAPLDRHYSSVPSRSSTQKGKGRAIPEEEDFSPRARIDDMADDMNVFTLRQLMDRDRRRNDRKQRYDQDKLAQKLQRSIEKQKAAMVKSEDRGTAVAKDDSKEDDNKEYDSKEDKGSPDLPASEEPIIQTAHAVNLSTASMSLPSARAPANVSVVTTSASPHKTSSTERPERPSTISISRSLKSNSGHRLRSIFKRDESKHHGKDEKKAAAPPVSEFKNESRENVFYQQHDNPQVFVIERGYHLPMTPSPQPSPKPQPIVDTVPSPKAQGNTGPPKRMRSKFREHLPDFVTPASPPVSRQSRPQSPNQPASPTSPYIDDSSKVEAMDDEQLVTTPIGDVHPAFRNEVTRSRGQSIRSTSPEGPSTALLSQSLASLDSEGSWLSGRPVEEKEEAPLSDEPVSLHRAVSVDYGKSSHSRRISAGSARILDIPARSSPAGEKRNSALL